MTLVSREADDARQYSNAQANSLNKYYTCDRVAAECCSMMGPFVPRNPVYIEPSAGAGAFLRAVADPIYGFDIAPEAPGIVQMDFLRGDPRDHIPGGSPSVVIGNPPFGHRSSLALDFLNRSLEIAGLVGFVLPISFRKWSAQSRVNASARLILDHDLPDDSFEFLGSPYRLRCSFQVWSLGHCEIPDLRFRNKPAISHPDFELWQYNCTAGAEKYFQRPWQFAVHRQGFHDYGHRVFRAEDCDRRRHWMLFRATDDDVLGRLMSMDFAALSRKNAVTPGFGKADVVEEYNRHWPTSRRADVRLAA